ncbi:MAG TPA: hypothetical protein VNT22_11500 [Baekduia sp.]|nr:hypothetical protein [Baekduia sp.]
MTARDRTVVMVIGLLAIVGLIWFTVIGPRHKDFSTASSALTTAQSRLDAANETFKTAQVAKRSYSADYSAIAELGKAVPVDDEISSLLYQLSSAADRHQIDFRSMKLGTGGGGVAPVVPTSTTPAPAGTATTGTTSTPAPAAAAPVATPAPATNVAAATLPPGATLGSAGFPTMPFDFVFDGSFFDMSSFLRQLDEFTTIKKGELAVRGRLLTINGISISASRDGFPKIKASVNATAFLLPADQGLTAGATAQAPAAVTTASTGSATPPAATAGVSK